MKRIVQPEAEIFGRHVRELRTKRKMTQEDMARESGLTSVYISNLENGFAVPSLTTVLRLARALNCKVTLLTSVFDKTDLASVLPR